MEIPYQYRWFLCGHLNKANSSNCRTDSKQQYFIIKYGDLVNKSYYLLHQNIFFRNYSVANFCFVPFLFNVLNLLQYKEYTVPQENEAAKSSSIFLNH